MKRDMELIRKILLAVEDSPHGFAPGGLGIEGRDAEAIGYHSHLMIEAGLARGSSATNARSPSPAALINSLTWKGHEFLDAARDESRWARAMEIVKEKGGSITMDVMKGLLTKLAEMAYGLG